MNQEADQFSSFRFGIQGYPNFYGLIVEEYFKVAGYRVLRRPALVGRASSSGWSTPSSAGTSG